jgi:dihydroxyacid dehydratase/phosphogluconate dehydratase
LLPGSKERREEQIFAMDARIDIKSRLPSRHVTEDRSRAHVSLIDVAEIFKKTLNAAGLKRASRDVAKDMREVRDIPLLMKTLLDNGHLHGDCTTVTGRPIAEDLKSVKPNPHPDVVRCAPDGAIAEVADMSKLTFAEQARSFPGAVVGGLLRDGDILEIDAETGTLNVKLTGAELTKRRTKSKLQETNHRSGARWKCAQQVGPAVGGAVTHPGGAHEKQCHVEI